jgi:hypothetical protein
MKTCSRKSLTDFSVKPQVWPEDTGPRMGPQGFPSGGRTLWLEHLQRWQPRQGGAEGPWKARGGRQRATPLDPTPTALTRRVRGQERPRSRACRPSARCRGFKASSSELLPVAGCMGWWHNHRHRQNPVPHCVHPCHSAKRYSQGR